MSHHLRRAIAHAWAQDDTVYYNDCDGTWAPWPLRSRLDFSMARFWSLEPTQLAVFMTVYKDGGADVYTRGPTDKDELTEMAGFEGEYGEYVRRLTPYIEHRVVYDTAEEVTD